MLLKCAKSANDPKKCFSPISYCSINKCIILDWFLNAKLENLNIFIFFPVSFYKFFKRIWNQDKICVFRNNFDETNFLGHITKLLDNFECICSKNGTFSSFCKKLKLVLPIPIILNLNRFEIQKSIIFKSMIIMR